MQDQIDRIFGRLKAGEITRREYADSIDGLTLNLPAPIRKGLDFRRDHRTVGQFALQVYDTTVREHFLVSEWAGLFAGFGVSLEANGLDNSGKLVLDTRGQGGHVDYRLHFPGCGYPLEVKFCPTQSFVTYKVEDLTGYLRQEALVLTFTGDCSMIGPNGDPSSDKPLEVTRNLNWFLMDRERIRRFLAHATQGQHKGFGGKETVRLGAAHFNKVFGQLRSWRAVEPIEAILVA